MGPKLFDEQGVLQQMVKSPWGTRLNSMESIWDYTKRQEQLRQSKSTEPLQFPQDAWNSVPAKYTEELCIYMPKYRGEWK